MGKSSNNKIAILGATSHIAKGLIERFSRNESNEIFLFARSPDRVETFLKHIGYTKENIQLRSFSALNREMYDVLINCMGIGDPAKLSATAAQFFRVAETFDNLILDYLQKRPDSLYINFSSGAAYGSEFSSPANEASPAWWHINNMTPDSYYGVSKLYAETKHRSQKDLRIVDLRVFGYFSRHIDMSSKFLLTGVLSSLLEGTIFETTSDNIVRDYAHPDDLFSVIEACIETSSLNQVFDIYSLKPAAKFDILDFFKHEYGLKYKITRDAHMINATGIKLNYYSTNKRAETIIGYLPRYTALECIEQESRAFFSARHADRKGRGF